MTGIQVSRALLGAFLFLISAAALPAVISTFDTNNEGWRVGQFFSSDCCTTPTYLSSGGNPGGFLRTDDFFTWNAYQAPAAFLGNQSSSYGQALHVDQRTLTQDLGVQPLAVISDGTLQLQFRTQAPVVGGVVWTPYDISLLAAAGWEVADGTGNPGPAASEAQLQQVLGNLAFLHFNADWQNGPDQVDIDNVRLGLTAAIPEPSTYALMIAGLAVVGFAAKRRKKSPANAAA